MESFSNDIFISYSRNDQNIILPIVQQLKTAGYKVWIDSEGIYTGTRFKAAIVKAIEESNVFLFFSSKESNKSPWTAREIAVAIDRGKHIIPIKLDQSRYNPDVELNLINLDYFDYKKSKNQPQEFDKLLRTLDRFVQAKVNEQKSDQPPTNDIKTFEDNVDFHPIINSAITFQLVAFVVFFLTFLWTLLAPGCLAFYTNPQPSLFLLCFFMFLSVIATYNLKTHKSIWIGILAASDFFIIFYLCNIADYLYRNWFALSHQSSHLPTSIRYRLLYYLGDDLQHHSAVMGMHSYLIILAFLHIGIMCLFFCIKNKGKSGWQIMR